MKLSALSLRQVFVETTPLADPTGEMSALLDEGQVFDGTTPLADPTGEMSALLNEDLPWDEYIQQTKPDSPFRAWFRENHAKPAPGVIADPTQMAQTPQRAGRPPRYVANVIYGQMAGMASVCKPGERSRGMTIAQDSLPEWQQSGNWLRAVESLLTRPAQAIVETHLFTHCGPIAPQLRDQIARIAQTVDMLAGFLPPFAVPQLAGQVAGRLADAVENKPLDADAELKGLLSFGFSRGDLPSVRRSGNTLTVGSVKYMDFGGTRYAVRHESAERMEAYDPARPDDPGVWLDKPASGSPQPVIPEHYAAEPRNKPGPPDQNGISTAQLDTFITYRNRHYPVSHDPAFHTWRIEPPPDMPGAYRIPVEYDRVAKTWSPRSLEADLTLSVSIDFPTTGPAGRFEVKNTAVPDAPRDAVLPELNEVLGVVQWGRAAHGFSFDKPYRQRYDTASDALSGAQRKAVHRFVAADPLLGKPLDMNNEKAIFNSRDATFNKRSALDQLRRYVDLSDALYEIPAEPADGKPLIAVGEPGLLDAFKAGDIVTNGEMPLSATADGKHARRVLADQVTTGARAKNDARLLFVVHGRSARPIAGALAAGARDESGRVFAAGTRFRIESITRATPRKLEASAPPPASRMMWHPQQKQPLPPIDSGVVVVRLQEMLPYDGPAPVVDAKNMRTGAAGRVLRPDLEEERLAAALLGAGAETDGRGMHTIPDGGKFAKVDGNWQRVRHSRSRNRWELTDPRRPHEPGMPIVRDGQRAGWRSAIAPQWAVAPREPLSEKGTDGLQSGADGQKYIALYGRHYPVHYDAQGKTWRIDDHTYRTEPRNEYLIQNAAGVPVRFDKTADRWDVRRDAYEPFKLKAAGRDSPPPGIVSGLDAVKARTGIVPEHLPILQQVAEETNQIIAFRPIERQATQLIAEAYPTKNFHIKGKSSNWGPMNGFIAVDQTFSKLNGRPDAIENFNEKVRESLAAPANQPDAPPHAVAGQLSISRERIDYLRAEGLITLQQEKDGRLTISARGHDGNDYTFTAIPDKGMYRIEHDGKPLDVLCDPATGKAITADYDLLLVAPHISNYGPPDRLPVPDTSHDEFKARMESYGLFKRGGVDALPEPLRTYYKDPAEFYNAEHEHEGNASKRVMDLIKRLNKALGRTWRQRDEEQEGPEPRPQRGPAVVHHNMDATSPATDPQANYPATFFLPIEMGGLDKVVLVENEKALAHLIQVAKNHHYQVPLNPKWEDDVRVITPSTLGNAKRKLSGEGETERKSWRTAMKIPDRE
ncbi:anthrax toxin-like adenylyl cyclase domain-containing protein [Trinickia mobilis]|uniref:anthrax toxin-like adenylyl cyclase domain-containing protein n=1 Tax=Trinickia mobilis TaxID=2816356 RepID=UPI001A90828B|nr:anthrax toxin-like adenylyl cyclase domain-containing protein [Trinickia mobilis]